MHYDLNRVPANGKVILPLSMSRLHTGQNAQSIFDFAQFFIQKAPNLSIDFICVYTNGLYFNANEPAHVVRRRTTAQMLEHKRRLSSILKKQKVLPPEAFQFETLDNLILQDPKFIEKFVFLKKLYVNDPIFRGLVDDMTVEPGEAGVDFVLEEVVCSFSLRNKIVIPKGILSDINSWQLICYHGDAILPDIFLLLFKINMPTEGKVNNPYCSASYNLKDRFLIKYECDNRLNEYKRFKTKVLKHKYLKLRSENI